MESWVRKKPPLKTNKNYETREVKLKKIKFKGMQKECQEMARL